jgi:phosphatidylserine decarboxylase
MSKFPIRKESLPYILVLAAITLISFFFFPLAAIIPFIMLLFIIYFFRDPKREVPLGEDTFLSPADGTVMEVKDVDDDTFINGKAKKISISFQFSMFILTEAQYPGRLHSPATGPANIFLHLKATLQS